MESIPISVDTRAPNLLNLLLRWIALLCSCFLFILSTGSFQVATAAQVQHLNTQTATATGSGLAGIPSIGSFNIPSGKNRVLFIWPSFERDHCSPADGSGGLCVNGNTAGTGLGDNYPEPRIGTPPATTSNNQLTARVVGAGGTVNKQNALVIGGTPSGDTRFITISTSPSGSPAGTSFLSISSYHIVLFENEINVLLGGAASGTVSISLPDVVAPTNAGDDALLIASVFQNVEQTPTGFVRNGTATAQAAAGVDPAGNFTLTVAAYDAGQAPDEADDGKLVMATSSSTEGFTTPAGHVALATLTTTNAAGTYDTPNGGLTNEPNGMSGGAYFRNGGATPASLYSLTAAGTASPAVFGGTTATFLLESDNADVGDAPISYGNASHTISGIRLGATVDADASLLNNATATGDDANGVDDEDGVTLAALLPVGEITIVPVSIQSAGGFLNVWFDWNGDGDFNDPGEQMVTNQAVAVGTLNLNIAVPATAVIGPTFARFRVCTNNTATDNCSTPSGTVQSGEVEDYQFTVSRKLFLNKITTGGFGGAFGFTLTNTAQTTGTVTTTAVNIPTAVDGDTGNTASLAYAISSPVTAVTITENTLPAGWALSGASCVNSSGTSVGSLSGTTYTITGAEIGASVSFTCNFTNIKLPILRLQKTLTNGRALASDQFALTITGAGGPATVTTTGAGSVATGLATLSLGSVGAVYTLSELGAAGANLANYASNYSCTNALVGGQTPTGSGTTFTITAVAGDDLTCTFANTLTPKLTLTKTASTSPLVIGASASFTLQLTNTSTIATTAATVITDTIPTGLTIGTLPAGCAAVGQLVTCTVPLGLAGGASASFIIPITPTVAAAASVINSATASGGGDPACTGVAPACTATTPSIPVIAQASMMITKTDNKSVSTSGGTNDYVVTLTNQGPSPADGSVLTDVVGSGLTCPVANNVACSVILVGAICPAGPLTFANLTTGITIATFPANSGLQFTYTCNVN